MTVPTLYLISDLHIGGDEALGVCDFEDELIGFLESLAARDDEDIELVIVGDAFGLWEFTRIEGSEKLDVLIKQFPRIFAVLRRAGGSIRITLLPGNHDYELACFPEFVDKLAAYNVHLEQTESITRTLADRRVWIEHGNQHDAANRMPDYGNPYAQPIGFFITSNVVGSAGQLSQRGRYNWLKDIQSVYPTEDVPHWVLSNYFYREMNPFLRWIALPFLLLFGLTLFVLAGAALEVSQITHTNIFLNNAIFAKMGIVGSLVQQVLIINAAVLAVALALAIPAGLVLRDMKQTAKRFGLSLDPSELTGQKDDDYMQAAEAVFTAHPDVAAFVYGHTHAPFVKQLGARAVINTGTWIKQFERVGPRFGLLPKIYVPSYCLNYFRIQQEKNAVIIDYHKVEKAPVQELTLMQRIMVSRRRKSIDKDIPSRTVLKI